MRKQTFGLVVSVLMILSLVLASCTPATPTTTSSPTTPVTPTTPATTVPTPPPTTETPQQEPTKPSTEVPKYGGVYTVIGGEPRNWDPGQASDLLGYYISIGNEPLLAGDWSRGPAGTGETDWQYGSLGRASMAQGLLAESWSIPDNQTLIFKIRQGIKWWNKAPANGREFTAADAAWNLTNQWRADFGAGNFQLFFLPSERLISANATDKYTLVLKVPPNTQGTHFWEDSQRCYMMLPELWPKQSDWKQALGTGPFMVNDYVPASLVSMVRNPNYWQRDPVGPGKGQQLPYLDGIKFLIVPDLSTQQAAFRTGKIDQLTAADIDAYNQIKKGMRYEPEFAISYGAVNQPIGREDKPNLPFNNLKVRQAMNLAVDKVAILRDYYKGAGDILGWPYYNTPAFSDLYIPLDQLPSTPQLPGSSASVQELIKGGNVAKAKQLLTEAGYPNGFKTEIVCTSTGTQADFLAIIKNDLAKIGIDLAIKPTDSAIYAGINTNRTFPEMFFKPSKQYFLPHYLFEMRPESQDCASFFDSPETRAVKATIDKTMAMDDQAWRSALKAITPFVLEQSIAIWMPVSNRYIMWQPWVKNYYGCTTMGAFLPNHAQDYTWIDLDLKKSLGY